MKAIPFAAAGLLAITAVPAQAHHSAAMFDAGKVVKISGTVKEWQYVNPHAWLQVMVPDAAGKLVQWSLEGGRAGNGGDSIHALVKKDTFKPGDKVTILINPMKDGRPAGRLGLVSFADGRKAVCVLAPCSETPSNGREPG